MSNSDEEGALKGALNSYRRRGWALLPVKARGKAPEAGKDWQNYTPPGDHVFTGNIGLILGQRSGGIVDVDLDCPEAIALAPQILPPTGLIFGRKSKPRSHWLYISEPVPETAQFQTKRDGMLVELRSNGCQTVIPGSTHASGEAIEWHTFEDPARVDGGALHAAVQRLAAISLLAKHWPVETSRYNAEGALIGMLLRAQS